MMPRVRAARLLALALVAALVAAGCAARPEPLGERAESYPVAVVDAAGASVELPARPRLVVSLDAGAAQTLRAVGFEKVGKVVQPPPGASAAEIAAFGADLVILPVGTPQGRAAAIVSAIGATPVFRYGAPDLASLPSLVARLGLLVGRGPEGIVLGEEVATRLDAVRARVAALPRVPTMIDGGNLRALGAETDAARLLAAAGADPIVPTSRVVRFAELRSLRPTAWVIAPGSPTTLASLRRSRELAPLPAVADGRVFALAADQLRIGPDLPAALDALVDALHAPARP